jgi:hypothetical protein
VKRSNSKVAIGRKGVLVLILGKQPLGPLQAVGHTLGISTLLRPIESSENPALRICATGIHSIVPQK